MRSLLLIVGLLLLASVCSETDAAGPEFTADGQLVRPENWREWVFIGAPVTPNDKNDGKAAFPEFHNTYIDPESYAVFRRTGEFPDGTMIAKELVSVGATQAVSGQGYFQGDFQGLEVSVKDRRRFVEEPGGWAYFSFGHQKTYAETAKIFPTASCNACHEASAATDFVFTQYYPVLRAAQDDAKKKVGMKTRPQKMSDEEAAAAVKQMGGDSQASVNYEQAIFRFLTDRKYEQYVAEAAVRPSAAFAAHGDVRTYLNRKLADSLAAGSKNHPVGSFAVKELYKEDRLIGWATSYKARKDEGDGSGWYWFENLSTEDVKSPVASGFGVPLCVGCHSQGNDFVTSQWPFRK